MGPFSSLWRLAPIKIKSVTNNPPRFTGIAVSPFSITKCTDEEDARINMIGILISKPSKRHSSNECQILLCAV